jgi:CheY-like chemotaxis protein
LVVDDETDVAELFRQHFRREARQGTYVLHFAYSGEEALDKLCTGIEPRLRAILSDINMPVMDGLELLRQIKTRRPDLPVMMVTAYGDDERRRLAARPRQPTVLNGTSRCNDPQTLDHIIDVSAASHSDRRNASQSSRRGSKTPTIEDVA